MIYILAIGILIFVTYTIRFAIKFNRTNLYFNDKQMIYHNILIWVIPFFWIMIIKSMTSPTPGSHVAKAKDKESFKENGIGIWGHAETQDRHDH
jgi:hypothetical protein